MSTWKVTGFDNEVVYAEAICAVSAATKATRQETARRKAEFRAAGERWDSTQRFQPREVVYVGSLRVAR